MFNLLAAVPPTPTPLPPPGPNPLVIPSSAGSLWASSDEVINLWNIFGQYTAAVQVLVILAVVIGFAFFLFHRLRALDDDDTMPQAIRVNVKHLPYRRRAGQRLRRR